jgi:uncharacterized phage protein (TIGR01671 family)
MEKRTIKFRAWNGKEILTSFEGIWFWPYEPKTETDNATVLTSINGSPVIPAWGMNLILMQFTGLYDINKKEIYEGDIIKCNVTGGVEGRECDIICRVDYDDTFAQYHITGKNTHVEALPHLAMKQNDYWFLELHEAQEPEVIGNLYENPELWDGKN